MSSKIDAIIEDLRDKLKENTDVVKHTISEAKEEGDKGEVKKAKKRLDDFKEEYDVEMAKLKSEKQEHKTKGKPSKKKGSGGGPSVSSRGGGGVRCYMRYGNAGQLYRVCAGPPPPTTKPPAIFTPYITPAEFIRKLAKTNKKIKSYGDLSKEQKSNYHRLGMAQSRADRRENAEMNNEEYTLFLEGKRLDAKIDRVEDRLERKKDKQERRIKRQMEEKGILASTPEEIESYFNTKTSKDLKKLRSDETKKEFKASRKDKADDFLNRELNEDDDAKVRILIDALSSEVVSKPKFKKVDGKTVRDGREKLDMYEPISVPVFGRTSVYELKNALGFRDDKVIYNLKYNKKDFLNDLKKLSSLAKTPKITKLEDFSKYIRGEKVNNKTLNPHAVKSIKAFFEKLNEKQSKEIVKEFNKRAIKGSEEKIDNIDNEYSKYQEDEEKKIESINKDKLGQAIHKYKTAKRDAREKGKSYQWIKKNVRLVFDKKYEGDLQKVGDIRDILMGVEDALEQVADIEEDLNKTQYGATMKGAKRKKKIKELTDKQKEAKAKKEQKEIDKVKYLLNKINKKRY